MQFLFIYEFNRHRDYKTSCYCCVNINSYPIKLNFYNKGYICYDNEISKIRRANDDEINLVIKLLKKDGGNFQGYLLKKFFNIKSESSIKTYQDLISDKIQLGGYAIHYGNNSIIKFNDKDPGNPKCRAISEKVAKSMRAMAMISQLMPYYGGEITDEEWKNSKINKYYINLYAGEIERGVWDSTYTFLAFHTKEQRDEFLKNNEQLVKDYLMIE